MQKKFNLYSSEGCHLCEQAYEIIDQIFSTDDFDVVDIIEDDKLVELYGIHIPVFERLSDNVKLFWPFEFQQVEELKQ